MLLSQTTQSTHSLVLLEPCPLIQHPAEVYLQGLGKNSQRTMRQALDTMAGILTDGAADALMLDWASLRYQHTANLRAMLIEKYSPSTVNKFLGALRRVLQEALLLDLIAPQDYQKAISIKSLQTEDDEPKGRLLSKEEVQALVSVCLKDINPSMGRRDAALIAILRGTGLRREEAVNLQLQDLVRHTGALKIYRGKGGKSRTVYLPEQLLGLVLNWLDIRGSEPGTILTHVRKGGQVVIRHLTPQSVWYVLDRRAQQAGVNNFSPHDFRRTFISELLAAGIDLITIQKLAGHTDPTVTARYDRRFEETKRQAVKVLDF